jgi:hypothetical protein
MTFLDRARLSRHRDLSQLADRAPTAGKTERGAGYLSVRRTVEAAQHRIDTEADTSAPAGRRGAEHARLDRMYEVAILVAAACEIAAVPAPSPVVSWPDELIRLRDSRDSNARESRRRI